MYKNDALDTADGTLASTLDRQTVRFEGLESLNMLMLNALIELLGVEV